jgi:hypothetical protein
LEWFKEHDHAISGVMLAMIVINITVVVVAALAGSILQLFFRCN